MTNTYADTLGRRRHQRCDRLLADCECVTVPPGGWQPEATPGQVMEAGCPLCGAAAGEPCEGSRYKMFVPGVFMKGLPRAHVRRYQAAVLRGRPCG
jgi:hypothetical protein